MNNYFCVLPFFAVEHNLFNKPTPCCLLPPNLVNFEKIQNEMLRGTRPVECQKCWDIEDNGLVSDRMIKNRAFDYYSDKDIAAIEEDCLLGNFSTQIVKLFTSNLCNSSCVTCSPEVSTQWQSLKHIPINKNTISQEKLDSINWDHIKMLSLIGGEPLYEKKNLDILERLAETNNKCFIDVVSNGSVKLTKTQKELFKKFKNFNICLSIDGIEKQFEYIRYPLKWDTLIDNINEYRSIGIKLSVSLTISNLNILYYHDIVNWFNANQLKFNHNFVTHPSYFNINNLPTEIKKDLPFVITTDSFNKKQFAQFIETIKYQDKLKNINIKDYMPELFKVINNFREH